MQIMLDHASGAPFYQQIVEQIRAAIMGGRLKAGDALPSIRQLAADLVISVITTKRAYQELEAQRLIVTLPGRGTFVADFDLAGQQAAAARALAGRMDEVIRQARMVGWSEAEVVALLHSRWNGPAREE